MTTSACNGMVIKVVNSSVKYLDGAPAPIVIAGGGAASDGKGGTLTDASGNSPPKFPITVAFNDSYSFTASSGSKSGGWATGTLVLQCMYAPSATQPGTPQTLTVTYSGQPSTFPSHASNCTGSGSPKIDSANFTVTGSGSTGKQSACIVAFNVLNGGTASS